MVNAQNLKGFRDFLPKEARKREYVINALKEVFTSYGFDPLETPALEYEEILTGKYGDEGDKLMYKFKDKGERDVAMRYDQTVPLARVVAQYQNDIPLPFKRYQIQNVWRAENTQKGRFREFLQVDFDIVGMPSLAADAEILSIVSTSLEKLGIDNYKILVNDRKVFDGVDPKAITVIDKLGKIGEDGVKKELKDQGLDEGLLEKIKKSDKTADLSMVLGIAESLGVPKDKILYDPTLARGLNYYTGIIIEIMVDGYSGGSIGGGGRYDNLIGIFARRDIPAVGFSFGFDRLLEVMGEKNLFPKAGSSRVLIAFQGLDFADKAIGLSTALREKKVSAELWLDAHSPLDKQMKYADKKEFPYVVKVGEKLLLRDMKTGEEKELTQERVIDALIQS